MRTLHVDAGRQMGGGQWQALYLIERLAEAVLLVPAGSLLFQEASKRGIDVHPLTFPALFSAVRQADLVHVHEAHAHTLAAFAGGAPLVSAARFERLDVGAELGRDGDGAPFVERDRERARPGVSQPRTYCRGWHVHR